MSPFKGKKLFDFNIFQDLFVFLLGSCFGSFANVIIYRLPLNKSLLTPSHCVVCNKKVPWHKNIPLFGYFFAKGKCGNCNSKFSIRYPLVEFIMACLWLGIFYNYSFSWNTIEYLILSFGLVVCSFIDLDHMILPDEFTLGGIVVGFVFSFLNPERQVIDSIIGILFGGGIFFLVGYIYHLFTGREGLGGGDVKLLAWLGSILSWQAIPFIILTSSVLGSIVGIYISRNDKEKLKAVIPFGPFIALAALLYIFGLKSVGIAYINLFFPGL